jgi:Ribbon-helix-helix protein, copG family
MVRMALASQKTTVYLDAEDYRRLKSIARERKRPPAAVLREAVAEYVARHTRSKRPRTLGAFASGRKDLGTRAEELLEGLGKNR